MYLGPFWGDSWNWQYRLLQARAAKSCCGPVALFSSTDPSLFLFLASSSLFFSSSWNFKGHKTSHMPDTIILVSLVNLYAIFHCNQKMRWGMAGSAIFKPKWRFFGLFRFTKIVHFVRTVLEVNIMLFVWYVMDSYRTFHHSTDTAYAWIVRLLCS